MRDLKWPLGATSYIQETLPFLSFMWMDPKTLWSPDSPYCQVWFGVWSGMIANRLTLVQVDYFQTWFWTWTDFREIRHLSIIHCMLLQIIHYNFTDIRDHFCMLGWLCNWLDDCVGSCNLYSGGGLDVRFPGNLFMFKIKSESNPLELRSICWQSCHLIHQIKPDSSGYQEVKGFWDPSPYSWEKAYFTNVRNFGTHCKTYRQD